MFLRLRTRCLITGHLSKTGFTGLPWWSGGWESTCQCRECGFHSYSGKTPRVMGQLSPWATALSPSTATTRSWNSPGLPHLMNLRDNCLVSVWGSPLEVWEAGDSDVKATVWRGSLRSCTHCAGSLVLAPCWVGVSGTGDQPAHWHGALCQEGHSPTQRPSYREWHEWEWTPRPGVPQFLSCCLTRAHCTEPQVAMSVYIASGLALRGVFRL